MLLFVPAFSFESRHRLSPGCYFCWVTNKNEENKLELKSYPLPFISYDFLLNPFEYAPVYLAFEASAGINPVKNVYSISLNVKIYANEDYSGFFIGFSPLSHCNFGNLKYHYLNYRMGLVAGYNVVHNKNWNFETIILLDYPIYDDNNHFFNAYAGTRFSYTL